MAESEETVPTHGFYRVSAVVTDILPSDQGRLHQFDDSPVTRKVSYVLVGDAGMRRGCGVWKILKEDGVYTAKAVIYGFDDDKTPRRAQLHELDIHSAAGWYQAVSVLLRGDFNPDIASKFAEMGFVNDHSQLSKGDGTASKIGTPVFLERIVDLNVPFV